MSSTLREKVVKGVSWNLIEQFGVQGMTFVLGIILARLLTPEDFGLIGMIMVFFIIAEVFIKSGFGEAYVQKQVVTQIDANTVFYTNLVVSVLLYGILWSVSPAISRFFEQSDLINLTRVMGLVVVINAFSIIQEAQIRREIDFKRKTKVTLIATIISGVIGITSAYLGLGVWSLVIQRLGSRLLTTIGLWLTSNWIPTLEFSFDSFKKMFSYGSWILFASIIQKLFDNIYIIVIGKFFSAAQLGFYTQSKKIQILVSHQLSNTIGAVSFPVFSQYQSDKERLKALMQKFLKFTMFFIVPLLVLLIIVSKPFVIILLTEKWAPMIPYLQLLCIIGLFYPIQLINISVLKAQGKSRLNFHLGLAKNILRALNILLMYQYSVVHLLVGEIVISFISLVINTWFTRKMINYSLLKQLNDLAPILIGALFAGTITWATGILLYESSILQLLICSVLLLIIYIGFQYVFNRKTFTQIINLNYTLSQIKKKQNK